MALLTGSETHLLGNDLFAEAKKKRTDITQEDITQAMTFLEYKERQVDHCILVKARQIHFAISQFDN